MPKMVSKWRARLEEYLSSEILSFSRLMQILLPVLWEQIFLMIMALVSIWLMSFDGADAVSAVNMMQVVNKTFWSACLGIVTGGTVLVAQNVGAGRQGDACRSMVQTMGFAVVVTTALGALLLAFRIPMVNYLLEGAEATVLSQATLYYAGFCISFPFYALYQGYAGAMRGFGNTRLAWRLSLSVNCAELALTAVFVIALKMGVLGITLATVLSRLLGAVAASALLARDRRQLGFSLLDYLKPHPAILRSVLFIAVPLALEQFFFNSGKAVSQRYIASYGTVHMAANGAVNAIFDLINLPQATLRETVVTVVGMCIGCGRFDLAKRYVYRFLRTIRIAMVCLMPLTIPLSALILYAYGLSWESNRLTIMSLALIYTFGPLYLAGSFTAPSGLRAGGDSAFVSATVLGCMWLVRVTLSYVFTRIIPLGVVGINVAMVVEWMIRNKLFRLRLKGTVWYSHKLLREVAP